MKILFLVCFVSLLLISAAVCEELTVPPRPTLDVVKTWDVGSAYFDMHAAEYKLPDPPRGMGGALALYKNSLVFGSADGKFYRIDPRTFAFQPDFLPSIKMGADLIQNSKRFKLIETPPRLHDIIFADGTFYATYDLYDPGIDTTYFILASIKEHEAAWKILYKSIPLDYPAFTLGSGGKLAYRKSERRLYFSVGDFSQDHISHLSGDVAAQNKKLPWGKINYLDLKNNSFHVYSIGHRNPQGLVFLKDGRLIEAEHGPQGGDEINLIQQGKNYGWPYESYGTHYGRHDEYRDSLNPPKNAVYEDPMYSFVPSIAPSQVIQISGIERRWNGDLLLGSLKAMSLYHIRLKGNRVMFVEPILVGSRIRDLKILDGEIILLTDTPTLITLKRISSGS